MGMHSLLLNKASDKVRVDIAGYMLELLCYLYNTDKTLGIGSPCMYVILRQQQ